MRVAFTRDDSPFKGNWLVRMNPNTEHRWPWTFANFEPIARKTAVQAQERDVLLSVADVVSRQRLLAGNRAQSRRSREREREKRAPDDDAVRKSARNSVGFPSKAHKNVLWWFSMGQKKKKNSIEWLPANNPAWAYGAHTLPLVREERFAVAA